MKSNTQHKDSEKIEPRSTNRGKNGADKRTQAGAMNQSEDRKRRAEGKMTREEAINLLNALKGDEGTLNFIPRSGQGQDNEPGRNW